MKALITRKVGMTSTIDEDGTLNAVTILSATPCTITQLKNLETDGYTAVQLGFECFEIGGLRLACFKHAANLRFHHVGQLTQTHGSGHARTSFEGMQQALEAGRCFASGWV